MSGLNSTRPLEKTNGVQRSRPKKSAAKVHAGASYGGKELALARAKSNDSYETHQALTETQAAMVEAQEERFRQIVERIQSGPCCTIHALALEFNLSSSRLQHLFKQQTGACLGHVLTERRLQQATYLLEHTNLRIKEIACTVGYEHTSSFDRAFERRFGYSPVLYRQTKMLAKNRMSE
ncbi:MAG TPA: AraC family transcriptional regulator [Candidatus Angelobacter sp.]|nr:AraC family transcriptional regulator [Candidatus Angelobacter sp.]